MVEKIKHYYMLGIYKQKHVERLLEANAISDAEYNEIIDSKIGQ